MRASLMMAAFLMVVGCTRGPSVRSLPHTTNPVGAQVTFSVGGTRFNGELIAAPDSGYVIRNSANRLVFAPFTAVRGMRVPTVSGVITGYPFAEDHRELRMASRYPQGLSPQVLSALLARASQTAVDRLP